MKERGREENEGEEKRGATVTVEGDVFSLARTDSPHLACIHTVSQGHHIILVVSIECLCKYSYLLVVFLYVCSIRVCICLF